MSLSFFYVGFPLSPLSVAALKFFCLLHHWLVLNSFFLVHQLLAQKIIMFPQSIAALEFLSVSSISCRLWIYFCLFHQLLLLNLFLPLPAAIALEYHLNSFISCCPWCSFVFSISFFLWISFCLFHQLLPLKSFFILNHLKLLNFFLSRPSSRPPLVLYFVLFYFIIFLTPILIQNNKQSVVYFRQISRFLGNPANVIDST